MEPNKLILIACASSLITTIAFTAPSHAMPIQDFGAGSQSVDRAAMPQLTQTEDRVTPGSYEKRLEQASLARFGCGCASCLSATRQLVQTGEISL